MKKIILIFFITITTIIIGKTESLNNIVSSGELFYRKGSNTPYTGDATRTHSNNKSTSVFTYTFKDGKIAQLLERRDNTAQRKLTIKDNLILAEHYYPNGKVMEAYSMVDYGREGEYKRYYKTGDVYEVGRYSRDMLEGPRKRYFKNGKIMAEENYKKGILDGEQRIYNSNGVLVSKISYKNGNLNESILEYYGNGAKKLEGKFTNGNGRVKEYYEDGSLLAEKKIEKNVVITEMKKYNKDKKIIQTIDTKRNHYTEKNYDDNGKLKNTFDTSKI